MALYMNGDNLNILINLNLKIFQYESILFRQQKHHNKYQQNTSKSFSNVWLEFNDFIFKGKSLLDCTNVFSPNEYEKNDRIILEYFQ